jgi:hypothetical protein
MILGLIILLGLSYLILEILVNGIRMNEWFVMQYSLKLEDKDITPYFSCRIIRAKSYDSAIEKFVNDTVNDWKNVENLEKGKIECWNFTNWKRTY